jgi:hypothetical protein
MLNISPMLIFFQEICTIETSQPFGLWKIIKAIERLLKSRELNLLYLCFFFFMMTWSPSPQFLPQHLASRFHLSD